MPDGGFALSGLQINVGRMSAAPSGINSTRQKSTGFISTCGD
ncbi:hypothetical protein BN4901_3291 [Citrobacter europaeus]|uniref:Uncharacterized protein n=1 Tax=Citrobacter europaeus TaxID=1914243 RepID=A0ABY0JSB5_9ENTR|nr:hypothetical protein BN4901_3291 [Citrobacter europaeus]